MTIDPKGSFRASSQETYLTASMNRTNLKVFDLTMAKKILFDNAKNAIGVQVNVTGFPMFNIRATKEVVVSAGAFQSPQLLMVSG
jgi:choline dehydrogenase-like flavoprotein